MSGCTLIVTTQRTVLLDVMSGPSTTDAAANRPRSGATAARVGLSQTDCRLRRREARRQTGWVDRTRSSWGSCGRSGADGSSGRSRRGRGVSLVTEPETATDPVPESPPTGGLTRSGFATARQCGRRGGGAGDPADIKASQIRLYLGSDRSWTAAHRRDLIVSWDSASSSSHHRYSGLRRELALPPRPRRGEPRGRRPAHWDRAGLGRFAARRRPGEVPG